MVKKAKKKQKTIKERETVTHKGVRFSKDIDLKEIDRLDALDSDRDKPIEEIDQSQVKVAISIKLDGDVLNELRKRAREDGNGKYQTYLNALLRQTLFGTKSKMVTRKEFKKLETVVNELKSKLA